MNEVISLEERAREAATFLGDYVARIWLEADNLVSAVDGFRRDAHTSEHSDSGIRVLLTHSYEVLVLPQAEPAAAFSVLAGTLGEIMKLLEGDITVVAPGKKEKEETETDFAIMHGNLLRIGRASKRLYEELNDASREMYLFNADNIDRGYQAADIKFDQDALTLALETSRAISERIVRIDIDLVESGERAFK